MFAKLCAVRANRGNRNKKGFTLAELLIVVAILAVLVAIAIPVFTASLSDAKAAVQAANYRSAKAVASVQILKDAKGSGTISDTWYTYVVNERTKDITVTKKANGDGLTDGPTDEWTGSVKITSADVSSS